ncbi:MAG: DUF1178 family protein [Rubrivivax sp.]|nr:DUF1178 family protein [Rubrivivax sp.]
MKVLDLRCCNGHAFEGWFGSDEEFVEQNGRQGIECPLCADRVITRLPSAPRLNLSGAKSPAVEQTPKPADLQAAWLAEARRLLESTEDVGERFADEARRIHYGEVQARGIRGQTTPEERAALHEEGIEIVALALPSALKGTVQ